MSSEKISSEQLASIVENFPIIAKKVMSDAALFYSLAENNSDGLLVICKENKIIRYANPAAKKIFHGTSDALIGQQFGHIIPKEGEVSEINVAHANGRKTKAEMRIKLMEWQGERAYLLTLRSMEAQRRTKDITDKNAERLSALVNASPLAIMALDMGGRVTQWSKAATRTFGWNEFEVLGQEFPSITGNGKETLNTLIERVLDGASLSGRELTGQRRKNGDALDLQLWTTALHNSQGLNSGIMIFAADITEHKHNEARYVGSVNRDLLTLLPNRVQFRERLQQSIDKIEPGEQPPFAVLHFGLDRFKNINHSLGHTKGDQLLREAAHRLAGSLYDTDFLARTGGDEFSILLRDVRHVSDSSRIAQKLLDAMSQMIVLGGNKLFATASIGIAVYPQDGADADTLLHSADIAMQRAKERGGGSSQFHTDDLDLHAKQHLDMESNLHQAYERGEFELYYQPQINPGNGSIVGVESLLRWFHPEKGMIPPDQFIPVAERSGMIVPIGEWVLRTACLQAKAWIEAGLPPVRVAVNISARQFDHPQFVPNVAKVLHDSGLDPKLLELELTESMLVKNTEDIIAIMINLKRMGVKLSLDDFGTGYSALSYLARLPIDTLKIDQSFVRGIGQTPTNGSICTAIIALADSLGLRTISEGVETMEQLEFMIAHGCDEIQGYFFSRPLPADECTRLFSAGGFSNLLPEPKPACSNELKKKLGVLLAGQAGVIAPAPQYEYEM
ncbi:MAG: EAL domain-containing protein [Gallionella sp.]|nr:EAL domain-containing protein [Gallionella sp.]